MGANETIVDLVRGIAESEEIEVSEERLKEVAAEVPMTGQFGSLINKTVDLLKEK